MEHSLKMALFSVEWQSSLRNNFDLGHGILQVYFHCDRAIRAIDRELLNIDLMWRYLVVKHPDGETAFGRLLRRRFELYQLRDQCYEAAAYPLSKEIDVLRAELMDKIEKYTLLKHLLLSEFDVKFPEKEIPASPVYSVLRNMDLRNPFSYQ